MLLAFVLAQVAGPALPVHARPAAIPCPTEPTDDVVVCARSQESFRLRSVPPAETRPAVPKAEIGFAGGKLAAEAEQVELLAGQQSKRLMIRWTVPLGRNAKR